MNQLNKFLSTMKLDTLVEYNAYEVVSLSNINRLSDKFFLKCLIQETKTGRINFFSTDLESSFGAVHEPSVDTYSWYVCVYTPGNVNPPRLSDIVSELSVEVKSHTNILDADRREIIIQWEREYVRALQSSRSEEQKSDLLKSMETTLNEGTHIIYRKNDRLIGHGAFVEDVNEVLDLPNLYVHLWVRQTESKETRGAILSHYFSSLQAKKKVLSAGIAVNNIKSLRVYSKNLFRPAMLSMGVYK